MSPAVRDLCNQARTAQQAGDNNTALALALEGALINYFELHPEERTNTKMEVLTAGRQAVNAENNFRETRTESDKKGENRCYHS